MDNDQTDYIRHRLQRYEESIQETEEHFDRLESFGSYRASAPFGEKFGIPILIDSLKSDSDNGSRFWREYDRITGKLHGFVVRKGTPYRDLLVGDLRNYVAAYHAALCYAELNMITLESDHDLINREAIRALLAELTEDDATREIEKLVRTLDESCLRMNKTAGTSSLPSHVRDMSGPAPLITRGEPRVTCGDIEQVRHI